MPYCACVPSVYVSCIRAHKRMHSGRVTESRCIETAIGILGAGFSGLLTMKLRRFVEVERFYWEFALLSDCGYSGRASANTCTYTVLLRSPMPISRQFIFLHIRETLYTYRENLCTPFLLLFLIILAANDSFAEYFLYSRKIVAQFARKIIVFFVGDIAAKFNIAESNMLLYDLTVSILFECDYLFFSIFYIILLYLYI